MRIDNFMHDEEIKTINFDVKHDGCTLHIDINKTQYGTSHTCIDDFTELWTDEEYSQLEDFIDGCIGLLHCYYHY